MERYDGKNPFTRDSFIENGEWEIVANRTRKVLFLHHLLYIYIYLVVLKISSLNADEH